MAAPLRIGLVTPGWPGHNTPNGIATSVYQLAMGLHHAGHTPVIVAEHLDGPAPKEIPVVHCVQQPWQWQDRLRSKLGNTDVAHWHKARMIAAAVQQARAAYGLDLLLIEETNGWGGMVRRLTAVPTIVILHGPWALHKQLQSVIGEQGDRQREDREKSGYAHADGILSPSYSVLKAMQDKGQLPDRPQTVVVNALAADATASLAATEAESGILFVGRFDRHKGGDTVLEAFSRLSEHSSDARLTFVGIDMGVRDTDGCVLHIEEAMQRLPASVRSRLHFTGPLDWTEIAQLRQTHAIALIASRFENLNYTMLEAMAAGQSIVATGVGGLTEALQDQHTALLVPPEDAEAMAAALARLIDDPDLRSQLGMAARDRLLQDFSPEVVAEQILAFASQVLAR